MKVLLQMDEHERGLLKQVELIVGFELADVTLSVDTECREIYGAHGGLATAMIMATKLNLKGTVVGTIYEETRSKETQKNPANERKLGFDGQGKEAGGGVKQLPVWNKETGLVTRPSGGTTNG